MEKLLLNEPIENIPGNMLCIESGEKCRFLNVPWFHGHPWCKLFQSPLNVQMFGVLKCPTCLNHMEIKYKNRLRDIIIDYIREGYEPIYSGKVAVNDYLYVYDYMRKRMVEYRIEEGSRQIGEPITDNMFVTRKKLPESVILYLNDLKEPIKKYVRDIVYGMCQRYPDQLNDIVKIIQNIGTMEQDRNSYPFPEQTPEQAKLYSEFVSMLLDQIKNSN